MASASKERGFEGDPQAASAEVAPLYLMQDHLANKALYLAPH